MKSNKKHIVLFCATDRGLQFLQRLVSVAGDCKLTVFSFREESWEPPFFDDIKAVADQSNAQFIETRRVKSEIWSRLLTEQLVDLIIAVSWRYMISPDIYSAAKSGSYVFHDSLLPQNRGFSPTVWAIRKGEKNTGVTLFKMTDTVDAGEIIDQRQIPIGDTETIAEVMARVTHSYLEMLDKNFQKLMDGTATGIPQNHKKATYNPKLTPQDFEIDWVRPAKQIKNLVRSYSTPYPGAFTFSGDNVLRVWEVEIEETGPIKNRFLPGQILQVRDDGGILVRALDAAIIIKRYELENGGNLKALRPQVMLGRH